MHKNKKKKIKILEKEHQNNSYQNTNREDNLLVLNFLFSAHFQQTKYVSEWQSSMIIKKEK